MDTFLYLHTPAATSFFWYFAKRWKCSISESLFLNTICVFEEHAGLVPFTNILLWSGKTLLFEHTYSLSHITLHLPPIDDKIVPYIFNTGWTCTQSSNIFKLVVNLLYANTAKTIKIKIIHLKDTMATAGTAWTALVNTIHI